MSRKKEKSDWNWATYFSIKKQKLESQFRQDLEENNQSEEDCDLESRSLFKNVGIFVNGFTNPTAIELKSLLRKYGGVYYEYYNERVTHIIASNLAHSKQNVLKSKLVVRPEWITECIKAKKIINTNEFLLINLEKNQNKLTNFLTKNEESESNDAAMLKRKRAPSADLNTPELKRQTSEKLNLKPYQKEYDLFVEKLSGITLPSFIIKRSLKKSELDFERLKVLLNDWIVFTSKTTATNLNSLSSIDEDDLDIFAGYLNFLLNAKRDLEKLCSILRVFKRLVEKNGCNEWINAYRRIFYSLQSDFFQQYDSRLKLD